MNRHKRQDFVVIVVVASTAHCSLELLENVALDIFFVKEDPAAPLNPPFSASIRISWKMSKFDSTRARIIFGPSWTV